jgi:hypothetical protein
MSGAMPDPPGHEEEGSSFPCLPGEPAAYRSAQLQPVPGPQHVGQVRRDLAVFEALDHEREPPILGC